MGVARAASGNLALARALRGGDKGAANKCTLVIRSEYGLEGMLSLSLPDEPSKFTGKEFVYVEYLLAAPNGRFKGAGLGLLTAATIMAHEAGRDGQIALHSIDRDETLRFYRKRGWLTCFGSDTVDDGTFTYFEGAH